MERPVSVRDFSHAVPLKAGRLRLPPVAPNLVKQYGLLAKTGEYLNKQTKEQLTILMRVAVKRDYNENSWTQEYKEEKFLWSWDFQTTKDISSFLKTVPEGMCKHTRDNIGKKDKCCTGICSRTECSILRPEDLIMTFFKAQMTNEERNKRYIEFLDMFGVNTKEYVLFDPDDQHLNPERGMLLVTNIQKRTIRSVGDSNGEKHLSFSIIYNGDSKLEAAKNFVRPLALRAKRASVTREFVVLHLSHDDSYTLNEWFGLVGQSIRGAYGPAWNDALKSAFAAELKGNGVAEKPAKFLLDPEYQKMITEVRLAGDTRWTGDYGNLPETLTARTSSPLTFEQLFHYLNPKQNTSDLNRNFERFIVGAVNGVTAESEVTSVEVLVDKKNSWDGVVGIFEPATQTSDVSVSAKGELAYGNWISELTTDFIPTTLKKWLTMLTDPLATLGLTKNERKEGQEFMFNRHGDHRITRNFAMTKQFSVDYDEAKCPTSFTVAWRTPPGSGSMSNDGSINAELQRVLLQVSPKKATKEEKEDKELDDLDLNGFLSLLMNKPGQAKKFASENEKVKEKVFQKLDPLLGKPNEKTFWESGKWRNLELVVQYLSKGTLDEVRLILLRYFNSLAATEARKSIEVLEELCLAVELTLKGCANMLILEAGLRLLISLMDPRTKHDDQEEQADQGLRSNFACITFAEVVRAVTAANKITTQLDLEVLRISSTYLVGLFTEHNSLPKSVSDACNLLQDLVKVKKSELKFLNGLKRASFKKKLEEIQSILKSLTGTSIELFSVDINAYANRGRSNLVSFDASGFSPEDISVEAMKTFVRDNLKVDGPDAKALSKGIDFRMRCHKTKLVHISKCLYLSKPLLLADAKTDITIKIVCNAEKMFGTQLTYRVPALKEQWGKVMLQDITRGLQKDE